MSFKNPILQLLFAEDMETINIEAARNMFTLSGGLPNEKVADVVYTFISQTNLSNDIEFIKKNINKLPALQVAISSAPTSELYSIKEIQLAAAKNLAPAILEDSHQCMEFISTMSNQLSPEALKGLMNSILLVEGSHIRQLTNELSSLQQGDERYYELSEMHSKTLSQFHDFNTAIISNSSDLESLVKEHYSLFNLPLLAFAEVLYTYEDIAADTTLLQCVTEEDIRSTKEIIAGEEVDGQLTSIESYDALIKVTALQMKSVELFQATLMTLREAEVASTGSEAVLSPSDFPEE